MATYRTIGMACVVVMASLVGLSPVSAATYDASACGGCTQPDADPDAVGFYNKMSGYTNWTGNFYKKYSNVKTTHYKSAANSGTENSWIDTSDIHYHVSHGGRPQGGAYTCIIFEDSSGNNIYMTPSKAAGAWGDQTTGGSGDLGLEWIGFRCCTLLNNASWKQWAKAMDKLHLLLGFRTVSFVDNSFGSKWAERMHSRTVGPFTIPARTVLQAWHSTVDITQPITVESRVIAETYKCYSDYVWGSGSQCADPAVDKWKWRWDHRSRPVMLINKLVNNITDMFTYEVAPRTVDETYVRDIGAAFGFDVMHDVVDDGESLVMTREPDGGGNSGPHLLMVSKSSGQYYYADLGRLSDPCVALTEAPYSESAAPSTAYSFLNAAGLFPGDATLTAVAWTDTVVKEDIYGGSSLSFGANCSAHFARELEGGTGDTVSVVGPGAQLKVFIYGNGDIMGAMGNWRDVEQGQAVEVMSKEEAWARFEDEGQDAAVGEILLEYDDVQTSLEAATQGYYEQSGWQDQASLIPVWIFPVDYYQNGQLVLSADTHIPATQSYSNPIARIDAPGNGSVYDAAEPITFQGSAVSGFGTAPYTYDWSSHVDGALSTQSSFTTSSLSTHCVCDGGICEVEPHTITLTVTDNNGLTSTDSVNVTVRGLRSDLDCDGVVSLGDLGIMANQWLMESDSAPQLLGHWAFDEGMGDMAEDWGLGSNDCTLQGDPCWVSQEDGVAIDFDGVDDYAKTGDVTSMLNFAPDSFSLTAWINPSVIGGWQAIVEYDRWQITGNWFGMWLSDAGAAHFRVGGTTMDSTDVLSTDQWHFLAGTFDGSDKSMRLYVNGQLAAPVTAQDSGFSSPQAAKLTIGVRGHEDGEYFNGQIDDVRIYDDALLAEEVQGLHQEKMSFASIGIAFDAENSTEPAMVDVLWHEANADIFEPNDIILEYGYEPVGTGEELFNAFKSQEPLSSGETVRVVIQRGIEVIEAFPEAWEVNTTELGFGCSNKRCSKIYYGGPGNYSCKCTTDMSTDWCHWLAYGHAQGYGFRVKYAVITGSCNDAQGRTCDATRYYVGI